MKSKQQVISFLKTASAAEKDALAIESFLSRRGIYVQFPSGEAQDAGSVIISLEDFKQWFEEEAPEPGEAVVIDGLLGIVREIDVNTVIMGVSLTGSGVLLAEDRAVPKNAFREATEEERIALQRKLNGEKLSWSSFKNRPVESYRPVNNHQVRISRLGKRMAIGVFREINAKGEIVMYCFKDSERLRYSLYEVFGPASDFQFEVINSVERKKLATALEEGGKLWNGHARRIEPANYRVGKDETYCFINKYFEIITVKNNDKPRDRDLFRCGNYFRTRSEAEMFRDSLTDRRNELFISFKETETAVKKRKIKNFKN